MAFEQITKITVIGRPSIQVPAGMTASDVMTAMTINPADYEQSVDGTHLILAAKSGSKGALDVRIVDGKVLPRGTYPFPTDADIDEISELFPEDNLFETLDNPVELQKYVTALEANTEARLEKAVAEKNAEHDAQVKRLVDAAEAIRVYVTGTENPYSAQAALAITEAADKLAVLVALAESEAVEALKRADEDARHEELLAKVREANPGLVID